jgi:hypothetical protein
MNAPNLTLRVIKLTSAQMDTFFAHFAHANYRKNADGIGFRRASGGAFVRMLEKMGRDGLWERGPNARGKPEILRHGPTALGVSAWLAQDKRVTPELREKAFAYRTAWEAAVAEWNAQVEKEQTAAAQSRAAWQAERRIKRLAGFRELFREEAEGFRNVDQRHVAFACESIAALDDDDLLRFVERIEERSNAI